MSFPTFVKITVEGRDITGRDEDRPAYIPIRAWRQMMKGALAAGAQQYATVYLPLHFTKAAYYRYPQEYRVRTEAYFLRNHIPGGTTKDNQAAAVAAARRAHNPGVFTGRLRLHTQLAVLKTVQQSVSVRIASLPYLTKKPRPGRVDLLAELGAVNSGERVAIQRIVQQTLLKVMKQYQKTRTVLTVPTNIPANSKLASLSV